MKIIRYTNSHILPPNTDDALIYLGEILAEMEMKIKALEQNQDELLYLLQLTDNNMIEYDTEVHVTK